MSILDDAIREHLELKRAHGADDAELKRLEDEAFGPPQRPDEHDPFAEAPTEFLVAPSEEAAPAADVGEDAGGRRAPNITDLQEAPPTPAPEPVPPAEARAELAAEETLLEQTPAEEEHPAQEHEAIADSGHSTEERHAIAEQPTEMFNVESQFEDAATEADAPSDEELIDAELSGEPRIVPAEPLPSDDEPADEFDEFFSEQRLSDELNQALEAPLPDEPLASPTEEATAIYEVEVIEPDYPEEQTEVASEQQELPVAGDDEEGEDDEPAAPAAGASHDDVLEDTPEFLEDAPEDDNLWFEQKPPKDIDFGD